MADQTPETVQEPDAEETTPAPPIESRFMFVDVAALRAKQLRRGALVRLPGSHELPHKLERLAMEEVRRGLVQYSIPERKAPANVAQLV